MNIYKLLAGVAALCLLIALYFALSGNLPQAGPFFIAFFLSLAVSFRGFEKLKGFTYTTVIFAAVTTALYYPQHFLTVGDFKLAALITPLIQIIMFGMGSRPVLSSSAARPTEWHPM
jgi:bile acid:Na+ symporter, BASS family